MNISYNWLKNYIKTDLSPEQIAEILTDTGLEVGGVETIDTVKGGLRGLVIGEVLTCIKHPNANKLSITTVNVGNESPLPIVCGAPNVAAGQKVVVATVGTTLYQGEESFDIKKAKIRGEESQGMICAEDEIGLGTHHDGIMVLDPEAVPGTPAAEYFGVQSDVSIEVDLTPNRIDGASHIGVARDLVAFLKQTHPEASVQWPSVEAFARDNDAWPVTVEVKNPEACTRYSGLTLTGVKVKESPDWLKNRLLAIGMVPINNIVDVTNFVLHEIGQPLHAFDGDQIKGDRVVVQTLPNETPFTTLDEKERLLHSEDLMICNAEEGMCIAGVFGGLESGVTESTTRVFLESACFNPVSVRKTARRHGLSTDASFRFERGTDPNITLYALKRAALLIKEVAGGTISSAITDFYPTPVEHHPVSLSLKHVDRLIGKTIPAERIQTILEGLEIEIREKQEDLWQLAIPPYRVDVLREADVVEDILRIYGYNNVEAPLKVNSTISWSKKPDGDALRNTVATLLTARGFNEIMCNSLTRAAYYEQSQSYPRQQVVELANPLSTDLNGMRQTLLFGGLESVQHNRNRRNADLKLFEIGNCYARRPENPAGQLNGYREEEHLALFVTGARASESWNTPVQPVSFFDLKSYALQIVQRIGIDPQSLREAPTTNDLIAEGLCFSARNGVALFDMGLVQPALLKQFDIDVPVYFAEMNWSALVKLSGQSGIRFTELSKFPEVTRDLALLIDSNVQFSQIRDLAFKSEKKLLKKVSLFDVYEGEKLGADKKSYAISFTLQDPTKTLTDKMIDKVMNNFTRLFEKELGAKLR